MRPLARRFRRLLRLPAEEFRRELDLDVLAVVGARARRGNGWERDALRRWRRGGYDRVEAFDEMLDRLVDERTWRVLWGRRFDVDRSRDPQVLDALADSYDSREPRDPTTALRRWRRAAEAGSPRAANYLGETLRDDVILKKPRSRPRDRREAVRWFRIAAERGDASAQLSLGFALFYGAGVRRDRRAALRWYRRAAASRDSFSAPRATCNIGHMYRRGEGLPKSWKRAMECYRRAAHRGNLAAKYWLGRIYSGDEELPERPHLAIRWHERAAEFGDRDSRVALGVYLHNGKHVPRDWNRAVTLYRQAAEDGSARGMYLLGLCYRDGEGVRRNAASARHWFLRAAKAGDRDARREIARRGTSPSSPH